jgi:hypothetical protein
MRTCFGRLPQAALLLPFLQGGENEETGQCEAGPAEDYPQRDTVAPGARMELWPAGKRKEP